MSQNQPAKPADQKPEPLEAELVKLRASNAELEAELASVKAELVKAREDNGNLEEDLSDASEVIQRLRTEREYGQQQPTHEATAQTASPAPEDLPDGHPCKPAVASKPVKG